MKDIHVLNQHEVNLKIISKPSKGTRSKDDLILMDNKYRDEMYSIYLKKRNNFFDICKKYNKLNQDTFITTNVRLHSDYITRLDLDSFLQTNEECAETCHCDQTQNKGQLVRRKSHRDISETIKMDQNPCNIEPWFKRYIILKKFIAAARKVILKNRLLKNLNLLKKVTPKRIKELAKQGLKYENVSYSYIFEKFL